VIARLKWSVVTDSPISAGGAAGRPCSLALASRRGEVCVQHVCSVSIKRSPRNHRFSLGPAIARLGACVGWPAGFDLVQCICRPPPSDFLSHGFSSFLPLRSPSA
jgi:hypothetical protein